MERKELIDLAQRVIDGDRTAFGLFKDHARTCGYESRRGGYIYRTGETGWACRGWRELAESALDDYRYTTQDTLTAPQSEKPELSYWKSADTHYTSVQ